MNDRRAHSQAQLNPEAQAFVDWFVKWWRTRGRYLDWREPDDPDKPTTDRPALPTTRPSNDHADAIPAARSTRRTTADS